MQLNKIYNQIINKLKTTTMAKTKNTIEKFEAKPTINFKEIDAEFGRLETFISDESEIKPKAKEEIQKLVECYQVQTSAKKNHLTNLGFFNTAVSYVNLYVESLNK